MNNINVNESINFKNQLKVLADICETINGLNELLKLEVTKLKNYLELDFAKNYVEQKEMKSNNIHSTLLKDFSTKPVIPDITSEIKETNDKETDISDKEEKILALKEKYSKKKIYIDILNILKESPNASKSIKSEIKIVDNISAHLGILRKDSLIKKKNKKWEITNKGKKLISLL